MKKNVIYLLLSLLFVACEKKAEFWKFDEDTDFAYGICSDYEKDSAGYYVFQYKRQLKQKNCDRIRRELVEESKNESYKNYSYTLMKQKYDFGQDKYSLMTYADYDVYDNMLDSYTASKSTFIETKATHINYIAAKELVLYDRETSFFDKLFGNTAIFNTPFQAKGKTQAQHKNHKKKYVSPSKRPKNLIVNTRRKLPLIVNTSISWMDVQLEGGDLLYVYRIDDSNFNLYEADYNELAKQIKEGMFVKYQNRLEKELLSCTHIRSVTYRIVSEWDDSRTIDVTVYDSELLGRSYNKKRNI